MLLVRSTKLLIRSTSRMLHVASVSTLEQHVERFGDKKSLFATCREKLNKSTFGDFVERLRYNVASVDDVATKSRSTMLRSTCRTQHCRQCGPALTPRPRSLYEDCC